MVCEMVLFLCSKCKDRVWDCTPLANGKCNGLCAATGDPHYKTFDGVAFTYQGSCDYILARSVKQPSFSVSTTNVPCGTTGVTCTKSLRITAGSLSIALVQGMKPTVNGQPIKQNNYRFKGGSITRNELVTAVSLDIGLELIYDEGMMTTSFCGNYLD